MRSPPRARRPSPPLVVALLASAALGCFPTVEEAQKKHGAAARATLAGLAPIAEELRRLPPVTGDEVAALEGTVVLDADGAGATAALVYLEDLRVPGELAPVAARLPLSVHVPECASFLAHQTYPWDPRDPKRWTEAITGYEVGRRLDECGRLRALFVVRTLEFVRPTLARVVETATDAGAEAGASRALPADVNEATCGVVGRRCVFDGGRLRAEVHVYGLAPLARKGAFVIDVESSDRVSLSGAANDRTLESDLGAQVQQAILQGLQRRLPAADLGGLK
jgi:hypothetical protein